jgi:hypothetical protein
MWREKRLQTQVLNVAEDTVAIRSLDWDRDRFDIEFACVATNALHALGGPQCHGVLNPTCREGQ